MPFYKRGVISKTGRETFFFTSKIIHLHYNHLYFKGLLLVQFFSLFPGFFRTVKMFVNFLMRHTLHTYIVGLGLTLFGLGHFAGLSLSPRASFVFLFHSRPHNGQYLVKKKRNQLFLIHWIILEVRIGSIRTNAACAQFSVCFNKNKTSGSFSPIEIPVVEHFEAVLIHY